MDIKKLLFLLILQLSLLKFSLFPIPAASGLPSQAILTAAQVLSISGSSVAMALTLELVADTVSSLSPTITVFSPSDAAFSANGQPSLSLLNLHLSPLSLSPSTLRSLPYGTKIPTMSSGQSLTITTLPSSSTLSLNNVTISDSPIYNDGSLIIYQIPKFFSPNFTATATAPSASSPTCPRVTPSSSFHDASQLLSSRGYSITASFLSLQLTQNPSNLTVFAPIDDVIGHSAANLTELGSILLRHVAPCVVGYADLTAMGEGAVIRTYSEGFNIRVGKSSGLVMVNEIPVTFPDLYASDWLIVHGLHEVFEPEVVAVGVAAPPQVVGSSGRGTEF